MIVLLYLAHILQVYTSHWKCLHWLRMFKVTRHSPPL